MLLKTKSAVEGGRKEADRIGIGWEENEFPPPHTHTHSLLHSTDLPSALVIPLMNIS